MNKSELNLMKKASVIILMMAFTLSISAQKKASVRELNIKKIELGYPVPARPFYHFIAHTELQEPSIIEVEASVDGKVLRATDLRRESDVENVNRPPISERPPAGYSLSQDGTHYKDLSVTGWVKWEPGQTYNIKISVKLKKSVHASADDVWISTIKSVTAPQGTPVFSRDWKSYKAIILSETAGISRTREPVEALLAFYPDEASQLARDIRVVSVDPSTHALAGVPCQVYDQM